MTDLTDLTVCSALKKLKAKEISPIELTNAYIEKATTGQKYNAYVYIDEKQALEKAQESENHYLIGTNRALEGIPLGIKDLFCTKGMQTTACSRILGKFTPPYESTVTQNLLNSGALFLGKLNMDEFAMGGSNETSCFGTVVNPWSKATPLVAGGSSGGSTAAVAANQAVFGLGTETGGSVRLPASYCGIYGLKPTYGVLSRWGVVAYGSSLDQVGLLGRTPRDIGIPLGVLSGVDFYDDTSRDLPFKEELKKLEPLSGESMASLRIAIPRQFAEAKGLNRDVAKVFEQTKDWFSSKGAVLDIVDLPVLDSAIASYYVIALSEAASNLSRFDGVRYGARVDNGTGYDDLYVDTRSAGFGPEVKRRIIIGNYVLSEQFSGTCYKKGMTVRAKIQEDVSRLFENYDLILCPTCPTTAFKLGQKVDDPLEMYLSDLFTTFVNLARIPSLSVPAGRDSDNLPVGIQFAGAMFSDVRILRIAQTWENEHPYCGFPVCNGGAE